jgi:hypothetical protein
VLSREADVEAHALREQGWPISAIARHLGHDRKTVRAYLEGRRVPEVRVRREATVAEPFLEYCRLRLAEDPHLWASTLHDARRQGDAPMTRQGQSGGRTRAVGRAGASRIGRDSGGSRGRSCPRRVAVRRKSGWWGRAGAG